jgi:F-type H+-transporting ATPase subunit delta
LKSASLQYANALADIAIEQGAADPVLKQLKDFEAAYQESAELRNFLGSPAIAREAKHGVIEKLLARLGGSKIVRNFLFVIADNQRAHMLAEIIEMYERVVQQRGGITEAEVRSARELNEGQRAQMLKAIEKLTGKKVTAKFSLDPTLLGGAVVRVGDTIYDGSVRNRLDRMRTQLAAE